MRRAAAVGLLVLAATVATACSDDDNGGGADVADVGDVGPEVDAGVPGAEWEVDDPAEHGIDPAGLEAAREYAFAEGRNTQAVVVVHDGAIVAEWYAEGTTSESYGASWSMAKSFTSALVGIAIEDGLIPGVDEPMTTWYPEWAADGRAAITLGDVLQMSSGLDWVEDYDPNDLASSDVIRLVAGEADQLAYAAGQPLLNEPGTVWNYSSGDTMLLSGVLQQATGMTVAEYAEQVLFDPIAMEPVDWWQDAAGHTLTYCCIDTPTRGFARFGLLYLHGGRWGDEQVVPADWVADSTAPAPTAAHYGYQWWLTGGPADPASRFSALGHDGQYLYVVPEHDLVVVRNGTYVKSEGPPVADPNLFSHYPASGFVPGQGTAPPDEWSDEAFLDPIVAAVG